MDRKITHGPDQQPLYGCCNCFEDYSHRAEDLAVYEGELWCDNCWPETDVAYEKGIQFGDLEPFVPEIDRLRAELERLRAELAEAHATIASKILGFDAEVGDVFDAARVEMLHICAAIAVGQTPQKPAARTTAAADLLARVRAECHVTYPRYDALDGDAYYDELLIEGRDDLMRELAEALTGED